MPENECKILLWNVNGNLTSDSECPDFVNCLSEHDIVLLSESWLNDNSVVRLDGFEDPICKNRLRKRGAKRDSGGLCCFFRKKYSKGFN